jgi:tagatose-6-phosphate ketose/aldose isomerase
MAASATRLSAFLGDSPRILLSGAGSSHYVGLSIAPALSRAFPCVEAIPSTEIVMDPESCLPREDFVLVSFARSGDSPEGNAAVDLAERLRPGLARHLAITCNPEGGLARAVSALGGRGMAVVLPEGCNDKSLAMTSSFTSMVVAGLFLPWLAKEGSGGAGRFVEAIVELAALAGPAIDGFSDLAAGLASEGFKRAFFVASRPFLGGALEAHLKVQELTGGAIVSKAEDTLGFRHGFLAAIEKDSLVVLYLSSDPYRRRFELDLARELRFKKLGKKTLIVAESSQGLAGLADCVFETGANPVSGDDSRALLAVLPGQLIGLFASLALGLKPDSPSPSGVISRVVQGVVIHPYAKGSA